MRKQQIWLIGLAAVMAAASYGVVAQQQAPQPMSFFVTSVGLGDGANLGGLDGADGHCQRLATATGRGDSTWQAYLSTSGAGGVPRTRPDWQWSLVCPRRQTTGRRRCWVASRRHP